MAIEKREDINPEEGERKYGDVQFADPTNKKYPIDTEEHVRAAWSYIHHAAQRRRIQHQRPGRDQEQDPPRCRALRHPSRTGLEARLRPYPPLLSGIHHPDRSGRSSGSRITICDRRRPADPASSAPRPSGAARSAASSPSRESRRPVPCAATPDRIRLFAEERVLQ